MWVYHALRVRLRRKKRVNQAYLVAMMEMGIAKHKAEVALTETGNVGVEVATEWLFSTPDAQQFEHYTSDTGVWSRGCRTLVHAVCDCGSHAWPAIQLAL